MDEKSTRHDIKEVLRETKVWHPLGKDSKTRIVAATFGTAGYPDITLGGDGEAAGERFVPNDARLVGELEARIATEFESLPGAGRVFLQLDDISSIQSGQRFLRIDASGIADFGPGGSTAAHVDAIYDLQAGHWLSIEHELAPNIVAHDDGGTAGY